MIPTFKLEIILRLKSVGSDVNFTEGLSKILVISVSYFSITFKNKYVTVNEYVQPNKCKDEK